MKRKQLAKIITSSVVVVALIAGLCTYIYKANTSKAVDVYPVSLFSDNIFYYDDSSRYEAVVANAKTLNIPLKEGLVKEVKVKEGDMVKNGDVLIVYDQTSFDLALKSDKAKIDVLASKIAAAENDIVKYQNLIPSEYAPSGWEETIDNGELLVASQLSAGDCTSDGNIYKVSNNCFLSPDYLAALRASGYTAYLDIYNNNTYFGTFKIIGSAIPETIDEYELYSPGFDSNAAFTSFVTKSRAFGPRIFYEEGEDPIPTIEPTITPEPTIEPTIEPTPTVEPEPTPTPTPEVELYIKKQTDPIKDGWYLSDIFSYSDTEGISVNVGKAKQYYGIFITIGTEEYQRYTKEFHFPDIYIGDGNYMYSQKELGEMIKGKENELVLLEIDYKSAQLTYDQDLLVSKTGEIKATFDGTVSKANPVASTKVGDTLITVKGSENYSLTIYVNELDLASVNPGDIFIGNSYESGLTFDAEVQEIGTYPVENNFYYGNNPNSSFYPVYAAIKDPEIELNIGEVCEATKDATLDIPSNKFYIPAMYIRADSNGSYVYKDDNGRLKKQYIGIGGNLWGYYTEVTVNLSPDDLIAFPYGKNVKEGVKTVISDEMPLF